jgi:prepilin-type N-terminal cleavage/methylation domain-containing protein
MKRGFSLIELIFVIVVLGIITAVGAEIFLSTAESYLLQKAKHQSAEKVELALEQISNRLLFRIGFSLRGKKSDGTALPLSDITLLTPNVEEYRDLEWISYDNDGLSSSNPPAWSGFIDLDPSVTNYNKVKSTGSNLNYEKQ